MSSPLAGAEINTFLGPDFRCDLAFSASVNTPVDSITRSTPKSPQGISAGSLCEVIFISFWRHCQNQFYPSSISGVREASVVGIPNSCALLSAIANSLLILPAIASFVKGGSDSEPSSSKLACL